MAKSKDTELMKKDETAIATAEDFGGGLQVQGLDDGGPQLSKVILYQGTAQEQEAYGTHERGVFLDALESRELGKTIQIVPIDAWASWAKFEKGSSVPVYSETDKARVPAEDLEWGEDGTPPAATMAINVVVIVAGEDWPYLFVFKRTGLKAFLKCVRPIEARRAMKNMPRGLYELSSTDDKNADGQPFKRLTCRFVGDPDAEMQANAKAIYQGIEAVKAQAATLEQDAPATDTEDVPF